MLAIMEKTEVTGSLHMKIIRDGALYRTERIKNLIVLQGRNNLAQLLGGKTGMHIVNIGLGEGNNPAMSADVELTNPLLITITESRIGTGLLTEDGELYDDARVAQFHFRVGKSVAVGKPIWEYGLFAADGTLFSRLVRNYEFIKDNTDMIEGYWQVQF